MSERQLKQVAASGDERSDQEMSRRRERMDSDKEVGASLRSFSWRSARLGGRGRPGSLYAEDCTGEVSDQEFCEYSAGNIRCLDRTILLNIKLERGLRSSRLRGINQMQTNNGQVWSSLLSRDVHVPIHSERAGKENLSEMLVFLSSLY
jgi:hypothetical protein